MARDLHPIALSPLLNIEFLDYILLHHHPPTTLIICSTREAFLQEVQTSIIYSNPSPDSGRNSTAPPTTHHLLHPTIHLIATSRTTGLAFTPSIPHLRAYLATYPGSGAQNLPSHDVVNVGIRSKSQRPMLAIWGLAAIHRGTTEYSAAGLSRTLAVAVEAANGAEQRLVLAESKKTSGELEGEEEEEDGALMDPWRERVPLLSGSVRFGVEGSGLGGRMVEVGDVVRKWCRFLSMEGVEGR